MNLTKYALYTALALVTYLLLLQWQEDYPDSVEQAGTERLSEPAASVPTLSPAPNQALSASSQTPNTGSAANEVPALPGAEVQLEATAEVDRKICKRHYRHPRTANRHRGRRHCLSRTP
jgi:hypothetical protein